MTRRLFAAALCVLVLASVAAPPPARAIPVFDAANFAQALIDHAKRLVEIAQRAIQIANQVRELEYWYTLALKNEELPYRDKVLEFLVLQGELLREFEVLKGQYQAVAYSLRDVTREFDLTFPGWKKLSLLAHGTAIEIRGEAGTLRLDSPRELSEYQAARTLQTARQTLALLKKDLRDLEKSQAHLELLKERLPEAEGLQQTVELQTSFAALNTEQLIAVRQTQEAMAALVAVFEAYDLNREMQLAAEVDGMSVELAEALRDEFGELVPEHTGEHGFHPVPRWAAP